VGYFRAEEEVGQRDGWNLSLERKVELAKKKVPSIIL